MKEEREGGGNVSNIPVELTLRAKKKGREKKRQMNLRNSSTARSAAGRSFLNGPPFNNTHTHTHKRDLYLFLIFDYMVLLFWDIATSIKYIPCA